MKKHALALLVAFAPLALASAQSSVWKVTGAGNTVYLGGTCHMLRESDFPLPPEFDTAYAAAQVLFFETDIGRIHSMEAQQLIMGRGMYDDSGSLQKELSPEAWSAVESYCARSGLPIGMANRFRPWMFAVTVAAVELQKLGVTNKGVDVHLYETAQAGQKRTQGLEEFEKHLEFLFTMGAGQENEMVLHSVKEAGEIPQMFDKVVAAWRTGDLAAIDSLLADEIRRDYPKVYEQLIVERNRAWMPQIEAMLKSAPVEFVLVGVGHLSGTDGLVAALQSRGFAVEQITATP